MRKFSLEQLKKMDRQVLFGELRSAFEDYTDTFSANFIVNCCHVFLMNDPSYFLNTVEPYVLSKSCLIPRDDRERRSWLSYTAEVDYASLDWIIRSLRLRFLEVAVPINSNGIEELFLENPWSDELSYISMPYTFMGDEVFEVFCEMKTWENLEGLDLTACNLDDDSILCLEKSIEAGRFPCLTHVEARENNFGDSTLDLMHRSEILKRLEVLDVTGSMELTEENLVDYASSGSKLFQSSSYSKYDYSK